VTEEPQIRDSATGTTEPDEPLKRHHSAPEVFEMVARPKLSRTVSAPEGQRWSEIDEHEWPEGDRVGTDGERGPHPRRQAQRGRMERLARVPSPVEARGHESV